MTLENLLKIGQLKERKTSATEIGRLLHAAEQSLADAAHQEIGAETRFDAAYKAIMQCSLVAMMAHGYRPDTEEAGSPCDNDSVASENSRRGRHACSRAGHAAAQAKSQRLYRRGH